MKRRTAIMLVGSSALLTTLGVSQAAERTSTTANVETSVDLLRRVMAACQHPASVVRNVENAQTRTLGYEVTRRPVGCRETRQTFLIPISKAAWLEPWPKEDRETLIKFRAVGRAFCGHAPALRASAMRLRPVGTFPDLEAALEVHALQGQVFKTTKSIQIGSGPTIPKDHYVLYDGETLKIGDGHPPIHSPNFKGEH